MRELWEAEELEMSYHVINMRLDGAGDEAKFELALEEAEQQGETLITTQVHSSEEGLAWVFALFHKQEGAGKQV